MPIRIVIADDHAVFRSGLRALLERESDMQVVAEAATGFEAIKVASENQIDVFLLDITMPGLPGPRVAESILRAHPRIGIIVLTMHEDPYYLQELFRIGVRGYVLKKSTGSDLLHAIRAAQRGEQYIDPAIAGHVISSYVGRQPGKSERRNVLTPREQEVCGLLAMGHTNNEIAGRLSISERTVETHRGNIMTKLELKSRAELVRFAIDNGLVRIGD